MERISYSEGPVKLRRPAIEHLVAVFFEDQNQHVQDVMVAICFAASNGIVNIIGDNFASGHQAEDAIARWDDGLFSINSQHGFDRARLLHEPEYNVGAARDIYEIQGFQAWMEYTSGNYMQFMPVDANRLQEPTEALRSQLLEIPEGSRQQAVAYVLGFLAENYASQFNAAKRMRE